MKIGLIQKFPGSHREDNIRRGVKHLEEAAREGVDLVAFAELAFDPFFPRKPATGDVTRLAEVIPGPTTDIFARKARELGIIVVLNLFESDGERTYDASPVIDSDGTLLGVTRMIHIADYENFYEKDYYTPGNRWVHVYHTSAAKVGVAICYDRHYPEYMRALGVEGAELVVVPQAGTAGEWPSGLFEAELQVACFQNGYFGALVNRVGREGDMEFSGESFITSPEGSVLTRAPAGKEHTLIADLDLSRVADSPARRMFLRDRRPEIY
ncbi:MAG: nitrilase-related carbon-nitrogen hydrolase [Candidatus Neomarinimicrobiota bacterium]